jgi:predicted ATPase/DNA-binding SARP family transcriptional activator
VTSRCKRGIDRVGHTVRVELRLLGSVGIASGGLVLPLGGVKPRLVLAVLLVHRNTVVSVDRLVTALWGDDQPQSAVSTLQSHLSRLRRRIDLVSVSDRTAGTRLVSHPPGYVLEVPADLVDAGLFEQRLSVGQSLRADPHAACSAFESALGLWRGPALAEFAADDWARPEAARLDELRLVATESLVDARLAIGQHHVVVGELEALVAAHPLRERLWAQLMLAQHRSGRPAEALRAAHDLRRHLRDLGLEPSASLRQLEADVLNEAPGLIWQDPPRPPDAAPVDGTTGGVPHAAAARLEARSTLPVELTPLIGREPDLQLAAALLDASRLVTLVGPGGVGKTRLALRLANELIGRFPDGVRVVELASVREESAVPAAVAAALDVQQGPDRSVEDAIVELLASSRLLLLLDNCEHVLEPIRELVNRVLRWCPTIRVLATSRETLGIAAEVIWSVPPLAVPSDCDIALDEVAASPAVALFVARAQAVRPDFVLSEETKRAVAEICIRLDGMPLALELAAARMRSMDTKNLADRLSARFQLLAGSRRIADPRYETLYDVVAWSYELATPAERILFDRLSVFVGGFELEQAEQVGAGDGIDGADVARLLANLVDKSMVAVSRPAEGLRYHLLETLREFGRQRLERDAVPTDVVRARHRRAYLDLVETAEKGLYGPDEGQWVRRLDLEFDNMRQAHATAVAALDVDTALRLVAASHEYGFRRIRYEQLAWADASVALPGAPDHDLYPTVLGIVAYGQFVRGELEAAMATGRRGIDASERLGVVAGGLPERALANAYYYLGSSSDSSAWTDRMVAAAEASAEPGRIAHALYMRSVGLTSHGAIALAGRVADEALTAARAAGSPTALAQAGYAAGLALEQARPEQALARLEESAAHAEQVGNRWIRAFALTEILWLQARQGRALDALTGYLDVIEVWYRGGDWVNQWLSLRHVFGLFAGLGRDHAAVVLHGALHAAGATTAMPFEPHDVQLLRDTVAQLHVRLGPDAYGSAFARGNRLGGRDVVEFALAEIGRLVAPQD